MSESAARDSAAETLPGPGLFGPPAVDELFLRYQEPEEIFPCLEFLKQRQPRAWLEVGSGAGISLHCAMEAFGRGCRYRAVDAFQRPEHNERLVRMAMDYAGRDYDVHLFQGLSQSPEAIQWARENGPYDVVLIDADHTFLPCLADIVNYAPLLSPEGALVMHDTDELGIRDGEKKRGFARPDCRHLWQAMKALLPGDAITEFVTPHSRPGSKKGIGVVEARALGVVR